MNADDVQQLYNLAGPLGPLGEVAERERDDQAWIAARLPEDARPMLEALDTLPGPWVNAESAAYLVMMALCRLAREAPDQVLPVLTGAIAKPGLGQGAAICALGDLPDGAGLAVLLGIDPHRLHDDAQVDWVLTLAETGLPEAMARVRAVAASEGSPPAARAEAQRVIANLKP